MAEVAGATALLGLAIVIVGLPVALVLRRPQDGWVAVGVEASGYGLLLVPLAVTGWAWLGVAGVAAVGAMWVAAVLGVALRRVDLPAMWRRPDSRSAALGGVWVLVLAGAGLVRLREVNFLPWIGDMGAYVNWANEFVRTGQLHSDWPPLFPAWLTVGSALFGSAHTTVGMATAGMVLVLLVARLVHVLGGGRVAALGAGVAVAGTLHPIWFSSFPVSESLNAPLFVLWALVVHRAFSAVDRATTRRAIAASGVMMLGLGLLRGSGIMLVLPLLVLVAGAGLVRAWRPWLVRAWWVTAAGVVGAAVALWYALSEIHAYLVKLQLPSLLPGPVFDALDRLGLLMPTWRTAAAMVVTVAAVVALGTAVARRWAARDVRFAIPVWAALGSLAVGVTVVLASQALTGGEVWAIIGRMSTWLAVGAVAGLLLAVTAARPVAQLSLVLPGATALMFLTLHSVRLGGTREHSFYLYWDRYLFSEVFPVLVVLTFLAAGWSAAWFLGRYRLSDHPWAAISTRFAVTGVVASLVVVPGIPAVSLATQDVFLRGAYQLDSGVLALAEEGEGPIFWGADGPGGVPGYTAFPSTWMAFAVPLVVSFGQPVLDAQRGATIDFRPDAVLRADEVPLVSACTDRGDFVLLEVSAAGGEPANERLAGSGAEITYLGRVSEPVLFLGQPPGSRGWYAVVFTVTAWQVRASSTVEPTATECARIGL